MSGETPPHTAAIRNVTILGLALNLLLALLKGGVGVVASSQALLADAVHSLSDISTDLAVLIGVRFWTAPPDENHPHGHGRLETLVSLFIGLALTAVAVGLAWNALVNLNTPSSAIPGWPAFWMACAALLSKEVLYRMTVRVARTHRSSALMANAWHHRSDAFSSLPVALSVLGARLHPAWGFIDPLAAFLVSVLILHAAWAIAWPAFRQLIDAGADAVARDRIMTIALENSGVRSVHALRTRHIGSGLQVDIHVQVDGALSVREGHAIAGAVKQRLLAEGPDIVDVLIHLEPAEEA